MKEIKLTKGFVTIVDDEDYARLSKLSWFAQRGFSKWYASRCQYIGKIKGKHKSKHLYMHNFLVGVIPKGKMIDHINGDGLDNRKCNLRICTKQENGRNRAKHAGNTKNKYKGVYRYRGEKKFTVRIVIKKGKQIILGAYADEQEAAMAYNMAALKHFRQFARLNFIP